MNPITLVSLVLILAGATAQHNYSDFRNFDNDNGYEKVVYDDDGEFAILYG